MPESDLRHSLASIWPYFRRFFAFTRADKPFIALCCVTIFGVAITNTIMIWLISKPLNALQANELTAIPFWLAWIGVAVVINQACHFATDTLSGWLELRMIKRVRHDVMARCMLVSFPVLDQYPKGDLLKRLSQDLDQLSQFILRSLFMLTSHALIFIFYTAMLFWIDWPLAVLAVVCSPIFLLHQSFFGRRKQVASKQFFSAGGKLMSFESETLTNLRGVSSFNVANKVLSIHGGLFDKARRWSMRNKVLDAAFNATLLATIYLGALAIVIGGLYQIDQGTLSVGHLVSFLLYLSYLSVPVRGMTQLALQAHEDKAAAERVAEILDLAPSVAEAAEAKTLQTRKGKIELDDVTFAYPGGSPVLNRASLVISPGETVALVGPSGTGKSTLIKLLIRFYDPQSGKILIDDQDIRNVTLASLREHVAVVWQEPFLINDTVRNNLCLARPGANDEALIAACKSAHAWEFIGELPDGLETMLGADGVDLSAGQKQRITIAQAFLRDAPILVLDEASSALDSQAEKQITDALDRLRAGRTTLIIAHRFSAIRNVPRIVFFNGDGTVTAATHDDLLRTHPEYRTAIEWQTQQRD